MVSRAPYQAVSRDTRNVYGEIRQCLQLLPYGIDNLLELYSRNILFMLFRQTNYSIRSTQLSKDATVPCRMCWLSSDEHRANSSCRPHPRLENSAAVFAVPAATYTLLIEVLRSMGLYEYALQAGKSGCDPFFLGRVCSSQ